MRQASSALRYASNVTQRSSSSTARQLSSQQRSITPQMLEDFKLYQRMDIARQVELLSTGQITQEWLHAQARFGLQLLNPLINAVENVYDTPAEGLPIIPKASIPVKGLGTKYGLPLSKNLISKETSPFIEAMNQSLQKFYGITSTSIASSTMPGCGMHSYTLGTKNVLNEELIAGGSSGGAASAVSAGIIDCAGETDIGGSIRIPAAMQGRDAYKPSAGHALRVQRRLEGKKFTKQELEDLQDEATKTPPTYGFHSTSFGGLTWESAAFTHALAIGEDPKKYLDSIKKKPRKQSGTDWYFIFFAYN